VTVSWAQPSRAAGALTISRSSAEHSARPRATLTACRRFHLPDRARCCWARLVTCSATSWARTPGPWPLTATLPGGWLIGSPTKTRRSAGKRPSAGTRHLGRAQHSVGAHRGKLGCRRGEQRRRHLRECPDLAAAVGVELRPTALSAMVTNLRDAAVVLAAADPGVRVADDLRRRRDDESQPPCGQRHGGVRVLGPTAAQDRFATRWWAAPSRPPGGTATEPRSDRTLASSSRATSSGAPPRDRRRQRAGLPARLASPGRAATSVR
jgi:hypothetical protein